MKGDVQDIVSGDFRADEVDRRIVKFHCPSVRRRVTPEIV
jgi:hypothetical protein